MRTTSRKRKRRTKRKTGLDLLAVSVTVFLLLGAASPAGGKKTKAIAPAALIAGTVFRDSGLTLPGAGISLEAAPAAGSKSRFRKMSAVSDARGEFAFRVPAERADYLLTASAQSFETVKKPVSVQGEERIDLSIVLSSRAK